MEEKDLKRIWDKTDEKAKSYYAGIESEVLEKAQQKSHDILARVRKNIIIELVFSGICTIGLPLFFLDDPLTLIVSTLFIVAAMVFTLKVYLEYLKRIKTVNEDNVKKSLTGKIAVLEGWIERVKLVVYIFSLAGFYFGYFVGMGEGKLQLAPDFEWSEFLIKMAISVPFLLAFFWGVNKYLYALYGNKLVKLKEVLAGLEKE